MESKEIIFISLAALFALGFVFFAYLFKNHQLRKYTYFIAVFRFISLFCLLLLLINPAINKVSYLLDKPDLIIAFDNSQSMASHNSEIKELEKLLSSKEIQDRYDVIKYQFSRRISPQSKDSLSYSGSSTNIYEALLGIEKTRPEDNSRILLISDGNQNYGQDYKYFKSGKELMLSSIVVGDTTNYPDLYISNFNVNKYAFLDNKFPVELFLNSSENNSIQTSLNISENGKTIYNSSVEFSETKRSQILNLELEAGKVGTHIYTATLKHIDSEKNRTNNSIKFAVEVIDEQTKVGIISSVFHPDLGMLKKSIEANKQRSAEILYIDNFTKQQLSDFQLVILYQPNNKFNKLLTENSNFNFNYFLITGTETDWNFLNSLKLNFTKDYISQDQDYLPIYNSGYSAFQTEDLNFRGFPPIKDLFGTIEIIGNFDVLLQQNINGTQTNQPLLITSNDSGNRTAYLFGENIWKWRSQYFIEIGSFDGFDNFMGKLVQYLASNQKKERLLVQNEPVFLENEDVVVNAQYFDNNYNFNPDAVLNITIKDSLGKKISTSQFIPENNNYRVSLNNLETGRYYYNVSPNSENISKDGSFMILDYNLEQQATSSNYSGLKYLAEQNDGEIYLASQIESLLAGLLDKEDSKPIERSREKTVSLIDWQYLLIIIILAASAEWFTRKYFGLL